jgi:integrase
MPLPPKVRLKHGRYYYVDRHVWYPLTRASDGEPAMLEALKEALSPRPTTFNDLFEAWLQADHDLRPATLREYHRALENLRGPFGRVRLEALKPGDVAQYLERRGGVKANREVAAFASVISWGMRQGWMDYNPCHGVRRNRERPRDRYVTDEEFLAAFERADEPFQDVLATALLTGLRQGDIRAMQKSQVASEGLLVTEGKRGRRLVISWTESLSYFVTRAVTRSPCDWVFTHSRGQPWSLWGLQSAMRRLEVDWTFHDLRAKAESDHGTGLGLLARYRRAKHLTPVR